MVTYGDFTHQRVSLEAAFSYDEVLYTIGSVYCFLFPVFRSRVCFKDAGAWGCRQQAAYVVRGCVNLPLV